jgi:hypothetical protein
MKKLFLGFLLLISTSSHSAVIELQLDKSEYQVGETVNVQLLVSDFTELLGGFSSQLNYASSGLSLTGWSFGSGFDDGLGSLQSDNHDALAGSLSLSDYAFLFSDEVILSALQGTSFMLASFSFTALSAGQHMLELGDMVLVNFANDQMLFPDLTSLNVMVSNSNQVPAPASIFLLGLGLVLLHSKSKL